MQEKVIRLPPSSFTDQDSGSNAGGDPARDYIIDMIRQLAEVARQHGDPLLGAMWDEVLQRHGASRPNNTPAKSSSGCAPN